MQSARFVVVVVVLVLAETTARAMRVGVGIAWTPPIRAVGLSDALVVSQFNVFCVISTTTQGLGEHIIGRESRDRTVPQLSLLDVMRQTLPGGVVIAINDA